MLWISAAVATFMSVMANRSPIFSIFFSSRRRHTRWNCDWSSDVCSSDLSPRFGKRGRSSRTIASSGSWGRNSVSPCGRSEERRVGKECRGRGLLYHLAKHLVHEQSMDQLALAHRDRAGQLLDEVQLDLRP